MYRRRNITSTLTTTTIYALRDLLLLVTAVIVIVVVVLVIAVTPVRSFELSLLPTTTTTSSLALSSCSLFTISSRGGSCAITFASSFLHDSNHRNRIIKPSQIRIISNQQRQRSNHVGSRVSSSFTWMMKSDPYRDNNNIRPSLHPITINILVQALKLRALSINSNTTTTTTSYATSNATTTTENTATAPVVVWSEQPLDIVMMVSNLASKAIQQRQQSSTIDQMILTIEEQQTIVGRVVGVMIRIHTLQHMLYTKCYNVSYIHKYNEWYTFGLLPQPSQPESISLRNENYKNNNNTSVSISDNMETEQSQQYHLDNTNTNMDPLLLLNRAECLLALFIHYIEIPELLMKNCTVPDQSHIDFLDTDRQQVLLR